MKLKNPVIISSGVLGFGLESFNIINKAGAFVTKTITLKPREGNPPPRIREVRSSSTSEVIGLINSVGLENPGVEVFMNEIYPEMIKKIKVPVVISIYGESTNEYVELAKMLKGLGKIFAIELNLSCPNVRGEMVSQSEKLTYKVVSSVRKAYGGIVISKLTPLVADIRKIAKSVEEAGGDVITACNSIPGMFYDNEKNNFSSGGLSGPCIKPVVLKLICEIRSVSKLPIIGVGGICSANDAIEFLKAGANFVGLGSVLFYNPKIIDEIVEGVMRFLRKK